MSTQMNIIEKVQSIAEAAKTVHTSCEAFLKNPNLTEVTQFYAALEAFANAQPKPVTQPIKTRKRRSKAEIEAEAAKLSAGG